MLNRCFLILIALALMPLSLQARFQDHAAQETKPQQGEKTLRIFIEGESSAIPAVIGDMRRSADEHGLKITFVSKLADTFDVRVILISGTGQTWDTNPNIRPGDIRFPITFAYSTAVVLTAEGKTVFTVAQSGNTPKSAGGAVAREITKNLYRHYGALSEKHSSPETGEARAQELAPPSNAPASVQSKGSEPTPEPGVYYKAPAGWVRLEEVSPSAVEPRAVGIALLTWGLSGVRMIQAYGGAQSQLQIRERKPTFYVRGFAVSGQDVQIVRLERKKNRREIKAASISAFKAKTAYSEHDVNEIAISRISSDVVAITPRTELKPGEYLLSFARIELGYDFGISGEKK